MAWHCRAAPARRLRRGRRAERALGRHRAARRRPSRSRPTRMRAGARRQLPLHPATSRSRASPRPSSTSTFGARSACFLYSLSGDIPRDEYRFFDPTRAAASSTSSPSRPARSTGCPTTTSTSSSTRSRIHGTFFGGLELVPVHRPHRPSCWRRSPGRTITQPALFIGAEFDSIFGQTPESVLATREPHPEPARTGLGGGVGSLDPAGGTRGGQRRPDRLPRRKRRPVSDE